MKNIVKKFNASKIEKQVRQTFTKLWGVPWVSATEITQAVLVPALTWVAQRLDPVAVKWGAKHGVRRRDCQKYS
ncbi:hypothetical protein RRG08_066883 [Elysia crispata]|uniref:Uncharacterized protein n=1 Tax=Elysia crispata TaxID=231223 RepID=A0AAE1AYC8_9GAST|nr:hypothetical protein RRG08_066883 [Elysia crispata]